MAKTYMSNASEKAQDFLYDKIDTTPVSIPAGYKQPETTTQIMSRLLLGSGAITVEQWEAMNGILYDTKGGDMDFDDFDDIDLDDEFVQSDFASYENVPESVELPNVDTGETDVAPSVQNETAQVPSDDEGTVAAAKKKPGRPKKQQQEEEVDDE